LIAGAALVLALASAACSAEEAPEAAVLVHELGRFPAAIDGPVPPTAIEQHRTDVYTKLRLLGSGTAAKGFASAPASDSQA
jgi:hypothetical protein